MLVSTEDTPLPMFRFTIRELVLLTAVAAMGVGWWLDSRSSRKAQITFSRQVEALKAEVKALRVEAVAAKIRQAEAATQVTEK
jgi:hypothetical protein